MRILILNWRDVKNPLSGGAEVLTHEVAKRLVQFGNQVTQFSSYFSGASKEEFIDGVRIIREGSPDIRSLFYSVHFRAFLYYHKNNKSFDVVIDEVHGVPFFTPWYVSGKKVVLICEVAGNLWIKIFGHISGFFGLVIEKFYFKFVYRNSRYITISESTKNDLRRKGIDGKNIIVVPMGINVPKGIKLGNKEKEVTLIFVGRLTKVKGIEDSFYAFKEVLKKKKIAKLWVVGRGDVLYVEYLKDMCKKLNINHAVIFFGYVSEKEKFNLLSRAHVLIHLSFLEGFGLTIPEAGYVGTPAIVYNVPGLRDIIKDNKNGILVTKNSPEMLGQEALRVVENKILYEKLSKGAKEEAKQYDWDNTARVIFSHLKKL